MLAVGLQPPAVPKVWRVAGPGGLKSSPRRSPIRAPCARLLPAGWRATGPGPRHHPGCGRLGGEPWRGGARLGAAGPGGRTRGSPAGPDAAPSFPSGPAGRGGARGGPWRSTGRSPSCGGGRVRTVLLLPGGSDPARAPAENTDRDLHGHGRCAGGSSRGRGLRYHGRQGGRRQRHWAPR